MKTACAFTIACEDSPWLRVWAEYYRKAVGDENIFLVWHALNKKSHPPEWWPASHKPAFRFVHPYVADRLAALDQVENALYFLLTRYRTVIFAEWDEFLVPDPDVYPDGLSQFLRINDDRVVVGNGVELIQTENEPRLDFSKPIVPQRKLWAPSKFYSKVCVLRKRVHFGNSYRSVPVGPKGIKNESLMVVHTKFADVQECDRFNRFLLSQPACGEHYRKTPQSAGEVRASIAERFRESVPIPAGFSDAF